MYKALYRKWRPQTFSDVVGQNHITSTLQNQVINSKTSHAYLFTGTRGTGKTTCAKILAKAVNCMRPINGNPCNECEICIGIANQSIMDIIEIDAASNNGVDDIRELRDEVIYTPAVARKKVYIIDEVHMLSGGAWNALLKTLEEPPSHIMFILATTEIQKVPQTITSRCQRFDFKRINPTDIFSRLDFICKNEKISFEEDALMKIASLADGSMRDGLSILEKCITNSEKITLALVDGATGGMSNLYLYEFTGYIISNDISKALISIRNEYDNSKDMDMFLGELLTHFRNLLIAKAVSDPSPLIECTAAEILKIKAQAKDISLTRIMYSIEIIIDTLSKIQNNTQSRVLIELCTLKLCDPKTNISPSALANRIAILENKIVAGNLAINSSQTVSAEKTEKEKPVEENELPKEPTDISKQEVTETKKTSSVLEKSKVTFIPELIDNLKMAKQSSVLCFFKDMKAEIVGEILYLYTNNVVGIEILNKKTTNDTIVDSVKAITGKTYKVIAKEKNDEPTTKDNNIFEELHEDILKGE
ncbi:MAG: DNA polymerase III subunit gamma/tau [Clostridia bacterium]